VHSVIQLTDSQVPSPKPAGGREGAAMIAVPRTCTQDRVPLVSFDLASNWCRMACGPSSTARLFTLQPYPTPSSSPCSRPFLYQDVVYVNHTLVCLSSVISIQPRIFFTKRKLAGIYSLSWRASHISLVTTPRLWPCIYLWIPILSDITSFHMCVLCLLSFLINARALQSADR
jgi:hypothetical protein